MRLAFPIRLLAAAAGLSLLLAAPTGCSNLPFMGDDIVVPDYDTVEEQARTAQEQYRIANRTGDPDLRREEMLKAIKAFQQVVDRFPGDRRYTPPAHLLVADLQNETEQYRAAEGTYRQVIFEYPEIPDVHSGALFGLADVLTKRGRAREGKEFYRQVIDIYGETDDPIIAERVRRARGRFSEIVAQ